MCRSFAVAGFLVPRDYLESERIGSFGAVRRAVVVPEDYRRLFLLRVIRRRLLRLRSASRSCLWDLGRADRLLLLLQPKLTYLSVGAYALAALRDRLLASRLCYGGGFIRFARLWAFRLVGCAQLISAFAVMVVYTGLLLWDVRAVPLWSTPWLPALFALSALSWGSRCSWRATG